MLKLQVTSHDSPEIVRTTVLQNTSVFYMQQCFSNSNTNNMLIYLTHFEFMLC